MKIATTFGDLVKYTNGNYVEAVTLMGETPFRYLDFNFYDMTGKPNHPLMQENWKEIIHAVKQRADELGMEFVQAHLPDCRIGDDRRDLAIASCTRALECCGILGIKNAVIHSSYGEGGFHYPDDQQGYMEANKTFFDALIPTMERCNVNVLLENSCAANMGGNYFPLTAQDLNDIVSYLNHPNFGAAWDVGHAHIQGVNQRDEMVTLGENMKAVHLHDNDGRRDIHQRPFNGNADWDSILRGLIDSGFKGCFTYEAEFDIPYRKEDPEPLKELRKAQKLQAITQLHATGKALLSLYGIEGE
ncbi:MAG: sugar phosphate isomerase/epimerase [Clostridia bacterium]|nr:sugar phosphate isomerase/epimerase [Clostridia bacterium]